MILTAALSLNILAPNIAIAYALRLLKAVSIIKTPGAVAFFTHSMPRLALPCRALPGQALPSHAKPGHAKPCQAPPRHAWPCQALPRPASPSQAQPCLAMPGPKAISRKPPRSGQTALCARAGNPAAQPAGPCHPQFGAPLSL